MTILIDKIKASCRPVNDGLSIVRGCSRASSRFTDLESDNDHPFTT
jgi:hypothetical protein